MKKLFILLIGLGLATSLYSQKIDLVSQFDDQLIQSASRNITIVEENGLELDTLQDYGIAVLNSVWFETGTIKLEIKGKDDPGRSFVGVAFNVANDSTYEAVYFRPFNFNADDQSARSHMVQYVCHPNYTWRMLRTTYTNQFESEITFPPDPEGWFGFTIRVSENKVIVYVEGNEEAVMEVDRLGKPGKNMIGLWVGTGSSGRFRNLEIY